MTRNWFTFSAVASAYLIIGSWHEEHRLQAAHPEEYTDYRRKTQVLSRTAAAIIDA